MSQSSHRRAQLTITSGKVIARHPLLGERVFLRLVEDAPRRPREAHAGAASRRREQERSSAQPSRRRREAR